MHAIISILVQWVINIFSINTIQSECKNTFSGTFDFAKLRLINSYENIRTKQIRINKRQKKNKETEMKSKQNRGWMNLKISFNHNKLCSRVLGQWQKTENFTDNNLHNICCVSLNYLRFSVSDKFCDDSLE